MNTSSMINPLDIPRRLLEKYGHNSPGYTPYPTTPRFTNDLDTEEITKLWTAGNTEDRVLALYSHFPFCNSRCLYCSSLTYINQPKTIQKSYLAAMKREVSRVFNIIGRSRPIVRMVFGGGTPTHMPVEWLGGYIQYLSQTVTYAPDAELCIEIDPRHVDENYLGQLIKMGFNRFRFSVQDLDPTVQRNINRELDEERLHTLFSHVRRRGLEAIGIDLLYGLPGQTTDSFTATVQETLSLYPSRISLSGYAHFPHNNPHQEALEPRHIPDFSERTEIYGHAYNLLVEAGYEHVGMHLFALPGDELNRARDNGTLTLNLMDYTTHHNLDVVGIGASAVSSVGNTYTVNEKELETYSRPDTSPTWAAARILDGEEQLRRDIGRQLFCNYRLDITAMENRYNFDFHHHFARELQALESIAADNLLHIRDRELEVTPLGRFFIRDICMVFEGAEPPL